MMRPSVKSHESFKLKPMRWTHRDRCLIGGLQSNSSSSSRMMVAGSGHPTKLVFRPSQVLRPTMTLKLIADGSSSSSNVTGKVKASWGTCRKPLVVLLALSVVLWALEVVIIPSLPRDTWQSHLRVKEHNSGTSLA